MRMKIVGPKILGVVSCRCTYRYQEAFGVDRSGLRCHWSRKEMKVAFHLTLACSKDEGTGYLPIAIFLVEQLVCHLTGEQTWRRILALISANHVTYSHIALNLILSQYYFQTRRSSLESKNILASSTLENLSGYSSSFLLFALPFYLSHPRCVA